ncbi:proteasome subunit alpha, partial [Streptomyces parvus]
RKFKRIVGRQLARLLETESAASTPTDAPSPPKRAEGTTGPVGTTTG